jgi:hypothetical protein
VALPVRDRLELLQREAVAEPENEPLLLGGPVATAVPFTVPEALGEELAVTVLRGLLLEHRLTVPEPVELREPLRVLLIEGLPVWLTVAEMAPEALGLPELL